LFREQDDGWVEEAHLDQHSDWVRDVAWAPTFSFNKDKIASCSQVIVFFDSKKRTQFSIRMVKFMFLHAIHVHQLIGNVYKSILNLPMFGV